ncbi:MAG TPA: hypothetical protein VF145_08830 [Chitinophagaceae bacterium]
MKKLLIIALLLISVQSYAQPDIQTVRRLYASSVSSESACRQLLQLLSTGNTVTDPVFTGYKASATMIMGKHVLNPFSRLSWFNKGKRMLEKAIASEPGNIELRFLRYNAQLNAPAFLGYRDHLATDKAFLTGNRKHVQDKYLYDEISKITTEE